MTSSRAASRRIGAAGAGDPEDGHDLARVLDAEAQRASPSGDRVHRGARGPDVRAAHEVAGGDGRALPARGRPPVAVDEGGMGAVDPSRDLALARAADPDRDRVGSATREPCGRVGVDLRCVGDRMGLPPACHRDDPTRLGLDVREVRRAGPAAGALDLRDVPGVRLVGSGHRLEGDHPQRPTGDVEGGGGPVDRRGSCFGDGHRRGGGRRCGAGHEADAEDGERQPGMSHGSGIVLASLARGHYPEVPASRRPRLGCRVGDRSAVPS